MRVVPKSASFSGRDDDLGSCAVDVAFAGVQELLGLGSFNFSIVVQVCSALLAHDWHTGSVSTSVMARLVVVQGVGPHRPPQRGEAESRKASHGSSSSSSRSSLLADRTDIVPRRHHGALCPCSSIRAARTVDARYAGSVLCYQLSAGRGVMVGYQTHRQMHSELVDQHAWKRCQRYSSYVPDVLTCPWTTAQRRSILQAGTPITRLSPCVKPTLAIRHKHKYRNQYCNQLTLSASY